MIYGKPPRTDGQSKMLQSLTWLDVLDSTRMVQRHDPPPLGNEMHMTQAAHIAANGEKLSDGERCARIYPGDKVDDLSSDKVPNGASTEYRASQAWSVSQPVAPSTATGTGVTVNVEAISTTISGGYNNTSQQNEYCSMVDEILQSIVEDPEGGWCSQFMNGGTPGGTPTAESSQLKYSSTGESPGYRVSKLVELCAIS